jgi:hypothetical protein
MPLQGLKSGLAIRGMQSGRLSGNTLASVQSGVKGGMHNRLPDRDKMLNPLNLTGNKKPAIYGLADFYNITGGNTTNLNDIANTGNYLTSNSSIVSRPIPYANVLGGKTILKYDGTASVMRTVSAIPAASGYTIMCMIKLNGTASLPIIDSNSISTGSILVSTPASGASACQIRSRLYSATTTGTTYTSDIGPSTASSVANTPAEFQDYMLLTCKFRYNQPTGVGSEQHMFINGRFHKILFGADGFSPIASPFSIPTLGIGNNPSSQTSTSQGFELGMVLVLPYWIECAEQQKIENYFRWYYNKSF